MTKSADQEHAAPSSSFPTYVFEGLAQVAIRTRTNDQPRYVDTRLSVWTWYDGGTAMKIDWAALHLNPNLMQIAKAFVAYALEKYAPVTAFKASGVFGRLAESDISAKFPWTRQEVVTTISTWAKFRESTIFFRTFYRWALNRGILGFDKETYLVSCSRNKFLHVCTTLQVPFLPWRVPGERSGHYA